MTQELPPLPKADMLSFTMGDMYSGDKLRDYADAAVARDRQMWYDPTGASNYSEILSLLGMEEEGDPVADVKRLLLTHEAHSRCTKAKTDQTQADAALAQQAARHAEELDACALTVSNLREQLQAVNSANEVLSRNQRMLDDGTFNQRLYSAGIEQEKEITALREKLALPETVEVLLCDFCGCETPDPWHGSTETDHHIHACDACKPKLWASQAPQAQRGEPVAWKWRFADGDLSESPFESRSECERDAVGYDGEAIPLYTHPQAPREQLAQQAPQVAHPDNLEQIIDDYVDDYVMEGDDGTHWPTESEKCLLKDAVMGLLADHEWNSAWGKIVEGSKQAPQVPMTPDEILGIEYVPFALDDSQLTNIVRAVEAHHNIKEQS